MGQADKEWVRDGWLKKLKAIQQALNKWDQSDVKPLVDELEAEMQAYVDRPYDYD
jgi:hypothetical protein